MNSDTFEKAIKAYSFEDINDARIEKYKPVFMASGGEHLVYEIPEHPNVVLKVSKESIVNSASWQMRNNADVDSYQYDTDVQGTIAHRIEEAQDVYREIKDFFPDSLLSQRYIKFKVPVTQEFLLQTALELGEVLTLDQVGRLPTELYVVALVQEKSTELTLDTSVSMFNEGYAFDTVEPHESWSSFLFKDAQQDTENMSLGEKKVPDEVEAVCQDFIERALDYSNVTGRILDIIGQNNIILYRDEQGILSYLLIDAVYPEHEEQSLVQFKKFIESCVASDIPCPLSTMKKNISLVANTVDYICKINREAGHYKIGARIDLFPRFTEEEKRKALAIVLQVMELWRSSKKTVAQV